MPCRATGANRGGEVLKPPWRAATSAVLLALGACGQAALAADAPSFDCRRVARPSIAAQVCDDPKLARLDRKLADVYAAARRVAAKARPPPPLSAEQRGWLRSRDDCWKAQGQQAACIADSYRQRTAELQARYRLLPGKGPDRLACGGDPRNELVVTWFATDPPSLIAERGDQSSLMLWQTEDGQQRYVGRNERIDGQPGGELLLQWGYQAPTLHCLPTI